MENSGDLLAIRPFTKLATVAVNVSSVVELRDSAGSGLLCNYIEVVPTEGITSNGYFQVFLSGINETQPVSGVNSSRGSVGSGGRSQVPAKFNLDYGDECSAIAIVNKFSTSTEFLINYGVQKIQRNKWLLENKPNRGTK